MWINTRENGHAELKNPTFASTNQTLALLNFSSSPSNPELDVVYLQGGISSTMICFFLYVYPLLQDTI